MNQDEAHRIVDAGNVMFVGLRTAIVFANRDGMSLLNPSLPKAQVLDVFWECVKNRPAMDIVVPRTREGQITGDALLASNIIRECGWIRSDYDQPAPAEGEAI